MLDTLVAGLTPSWSALSVTLFMFSILSVNPPPCLKRKPGLKTLQLSRNVLKSSIDLGESVTLGIEVEVDSDAEGKVHVTSAIARGIRVCYHNDRYFLAILE